jgi:hypothetical protein
LIGIQVFLDPWQYVCHQVFGSGVEERPGSIGEEESKACHPTGGDRLRPVETPGDRDDRVPPNQDRFPLDRKDRTEWRGLAGILGLF